MPNSSFHNRGAQTSETVCAIACVCERAISSNRSLSSRADRQRDERILYFFVSCQPNGQMERQTERPRASEPGGCQCRFSRSLSISLSGLPSFVSVCLRALVAEIQFASGKLAMDSSLRVVFVLAQWRLSGWKPLLDGGSRSHPAASVCLRRCRMLASAETKKCGG